mmetsp:Transcript_4159/g.3487  ORF Transcript_4159/g.3487 Transcript_4159/m.3487 type:complete len:98 (+) Transcript_4159:30-323(+)
MEEVKIYEEEYRDNIKKFKKAKAELEISSGKRLEQAFKDMQFYSKEANGSYECLHQQIKELPGSDQFKFKEKLSSYKRNVEDMKREVNKFQVEHGYK